ncbi:MAG: aminodeoxychorismate/anthranilate synthase component II [Bacteroidota bacterium]
MKILVLDNYDSFTYNLVHIIRELGYGEQMDVFRNDQIDLDAVAAYDKILLSPGPGIPEEAGIMPALIQKYAATKSILGICLGHQAIGEAFGAGLFNLKEVLHGVATPGNVVKTDPFFSDIPSSFNIARYHSWAVKRESLGKDLVMLVEDEEGEVMGMRHREHDVYGLQFHPESIITEYGVKMMQNWLEGKTFVAHSQQAHQSKA